MSPLTRNGMRMETSNIPTSTTTPIFGRLVSNTTIGIAMMKKCISQARKKECSRHCNTVHWLEYQLSWEITEQINITVWRRKTNWMSLFVFFISLLIVAQHVLGNHVPIIRS
jgi:hypothetical protein